MHRQWDVVVIGAGVAGLTAARAVAAAGLSCACIDRLGPGGALMNIGHVENGPDAEPGTTGADLVARLLDEAVEAGVVLAFGEVRKLVGEKPWGDTPWLVETDDEAHEARAVVIATGLSQGTLGVADEPSFEGRGLSHCASCDGPLFAGQSVVVAGDDRWTLREALELSAIAARVAIVGDIADGPERLAAQERLTVVPGRITALRGTNGLETVVVTHEGRTEDIAAQGVFAYLGRRPVLDFADGLLRLDPTGRILVDESALACVPFLFAVGDVRAGSVETVSGAIADGRRAGLAVAGLLSR